MSPYELSNNNRKYFGLLPVDNTWDRKSLNGVIDVYFDKNKIVKVLNFSRGYIEYDSDVNTLNREALLPKTTKGKKQKLTIPRILKIKGSGMQFSGSFEGGRIRVYDNKRNVFFIQNYLEDGQISNYNDISNWVEKYVVESPVEYFEWLNKQVKSKRHNIKAKPGDIIAFHVARFEYAFAKIIRIDFPTTLNLFGKALQILPYSFTSKTTDIDFDKLIIQPTLELIQINDSGVSYGEFPIVAFRELTEEDISKIGEPKMSKYLSIPYSKTDIIQMNNKW